MLAVLVGGTGYYIWQKSQNKNADLSPVDSSVKSGIVAVLGNSNKFESPSTQQNNQTNQQSESAQTPVQPYEIQLPAGWTKTDSVSEDNKCNDGKVWITNTYTKETETLTIYENGHPGGCDKAIVVDTYLDFNFKPDSSGLVVDTTTIKQCSKADNPNCPIGDGVVDLLIGNVSKDNTDTAEKNAKNGNTYYFRLVDTKIDKDDFENQIKGLASLVQAIIF